MEKPERWVFGILDQVAFRVLDADIVSRSEERGECLALSATTDEWRWDGSAPRSSASTYVAAYLPCSDHGAESNLIKHRDVMEMAFQFEDSLKSVLDNFGCPVTLNNFRKTDLTANVFCAIQRGPHFAESIAAGRPEYYTDSEVRAEAHHALYDWVFFDDLSEAEWWLDGPNPLYSVSRENAQKFIEVACIDRSLISSTLSLASAATD